MLHGTKNYTGPSSFASIIQIRIHIQIMHKWNLSFSLNSKLPPTGTYGVRSVSEDETATIWHCMIIYQPTTWKYCDGRRHTPVGIEKEEH